MIRLFHDVKIDWLGKRRIFIAVSVALMLSGMSSAVYRHSFHPNGSEAFNLGVDFRGGLLLTVRFKEPPAAEAVRLALGHAGLRDVTVQSVLEKPKEMLIKVPISEQVVGSESNNLTKARLNIEAAEQRWSDKRLPVMSRETNDRENHPPQKGKSAQAG